MEMLLVLVLAGLGAYYTFSILRKKLKDEIVMVRNLAAKNGWQFTEKPDITLFTGVAEYIGFQPKAIRVQYLVRGTAYEKHFELFLIIGA